MKGRLFGDKAELVAEGAPISSEEAVSPVHKPKDTFLPDRMDRIFASFAFILGFFFIRWVFFTWQGWGVTAFTISYCLAITLYFIKKGVHVPKAGYFWLTALLLTGISYSLYGNTGLEPWRSLFLLCSAVYYVVCASGKLILKRTSNWLLLDGINGMFVIPFKNFGCQYKSLSIKGYVDRSRGRHILSVALGLIMALIFAGMVMPLLMRADSGGFSKIANGIFQYYQMIQNQFSDILFNAILAVPVAAYLFGLAAGCAHDRGCSTFKRENLQYNIDCLRVFAAATIYTLLGLVCSLYLVFIGSQMPYFFSAFTGQRPEGWQIYSEYARSGFFELCQIAAINLFLLVVANAFGKRAKQGNYTIKVFNILLSLLTLLLIATAFSKMAMYIGVYGLSIRRLLPCLFMVFLTIVFGGAIAMQKWQFSIMRLSVLVVSLMICTLCLLNPDGFVAGYNADRYLSGTLKSFDVQILYQSGPAGVEPAIKVYSQTRDGELKAELIAYINDQQKDSAKSLGQPRDNLEKMLVRQRTSGFAVYK